LITKRPISEAAKQRLAEGSLQQVVRIAQEFEESGKHMLDLIQEGNIGLLAAVNTVTENEQTHFSQYVRACVEQQIRRFIAGGEPAAV
jgi:DNA-directed RNA polymerase sigma subunit (sigma70/sigma32)